MAKVNNLESLLASLTECTSGEDVTVRDMLNAVGRRSYGPILLLLGFIAISPLTIIPGTSWIVALLTLLIAGQIVLGRAFPWVPRRFLDIEFPRWPRAVRPPAARLGRLAVRAWPDGTRRCRADWCRRRARWCHLGAATCLVCPALRLMRVKFPYQDSCLARL